MRVVIRRVRDGKITLQETSKFSIITINRPIARNALTYTMWEELDRIARAIAVNEKTRVVILRGISGEFTSGSDIKELQQMTVEEANHAFQMMERAILSFEKIPMPVVCAIDGPALGAGFILSLACDLRIGSYRARMGIPVGRLGIRLSPSFVWRIVQLIGPSRSKELVYTSRIYDANQALELGLINQLVDSHELESKVLEIAKTIASQSRASVKAIKESANMSYDRLNRETYWDYIDADDFREGCNAFLEKRIPLFR